MQIAAGTLVVLAWLVHPYFVLLSVLVGAGLVFTGLTDTCGIGLLLARMPWNQVAPQPATLRQCQSDSSGSAKVSCH